MSANFQKPLDSLEGLLESLGLEVEDRPEEIAQVEELEREPGFDAPDLVDLESLPFVTIDNDGSRDLDQALYIEREPEGWRVDYALADAAWFVRPGTPLWRRSMRRGATFYFPHRAIPMLPERLSEGLISLNPNVIRRALVTRTWLDAEGVVRRTEAFRGRIRSRAKLTYDQVSEWLAGSLDDSLPYAASLRGLEAVGELRMKRSLERGVVAYDRDDVRIRIGEDGECRVQVRRRNAAEAYNEQISLLCNTEGARLLAQHDHDETVQSIYRVHHPPVSRRLSELRETIEALVNAAELSDAWRWSGRREELADYLAGLPDSGASGRLRTALERQILWTNRASEFSDEIGPHFALAVEPYARLSSPMREVVGVFTHKELAEALDWEDPNDNATDRAIRDQVIEAANRARTVQKQIEKRSKLLALDALFADDLELGPKERPLRAGTVVGVKATRLYLLLDELPIDVKVYVDDLERRFETEYALDGVVLRAADASAPSFRLGDGLEFRVDSWDKGRQRFVLDVRSLS